MSEVFNGNAQSETLSSEWELVKLRELTSERSSKNKRGLPFRVYTISNTLGFTLSDDFFDKQVYSRDLSSYKLVERDDFAYNPYRINVGSLGLFSSDSTGLVSPAYVVFRVHATDRLDATFLFLLLKSDMWLREIQRMAMSRGSVRRSLAFKDLADFRIALPPLPEQRRIAHVLSTIQRAIQAQDAVIAAARELKRSLMHRLFTYGPYAEPLPTKETDFGEAPSSWPEVGLEHCAKVQTGVAKGRRLDSTDTLELPYIRVANVQDGFLDLKEIKTLTILKSEIDRFRLQNRDVLLTEGGDFDKLGRGFIWRNQLDPCIHQNHIFAVRTDQNVLLPEFFSYLVQSVYGKRYFLKVAHRTTNLASINSSKLKALPVLLPPLSEQEAIVDMLAQVDEKVAVEEGRRAALEAFFNSVLYQLMTGQVRLVLE